MAILSAITALLTISVVFNLLLTIGVIKRLREHTGLIEEMQGRRMDPGLSVGDEIGEFDEVSLQGDRLTPETIGERDTIVAFFSTDCHPCKEKVPSFVEFVRNQGLNPRDVLAVVVGDEAQPFTSQLLPVARVATEEINGAISRAFRVRFFPTVVRVGSMDGRVVVKETNIRLEPASSSL
ncbi:TlpA family protein disulfide reductase [Thermostaphylospora chromogena]|uniref:Thioredoxin domain-containing protein n=1 Tax=Thermostaphylospora chromogena TaxID=35622 RepID=A0A1H1D3Q9_9ACTN|nr:hypothetical protein [Thermostaphylospora chromogena]SDQ71070.1 hypothetical protein SAMN04489764_1804 [Thermostaphylospora chromogena]